MVRLFTKSPLSITDQVALLKTRGLHFDNEVAATKFLSEVSYFRFVQYLRPMEADKKLHIFKPNSKFEDAVALYNFDTQLRCLMFEAIQGIEIALRTKVNHEFSMHHGAFWFYDTNLADDEHKFIENMNAVDRELQRSKEDFIREHRQKYDRPVFLPLGRHLNLRLLEPCQNYTITARISRLRKRLLVSSIFLNMKFLKVGCVVLQFFVIVVHIIQEYGIVDFPMRLRCVHLCVVHGLTPKVLMAISCTL